MHRPVHLILRDALSHPGFEVEQPGGVFGIAASAAKGLGSLCAGGVGSMDWSK